MPPTETAPATDSRPPGGACELSVVIPTFNESDNIGPLLAQLEETLDGIAWEAVFVDDDSPDGTAELVRRIAARHPRVRCIQRIGRRGLSTACIEGMLASAAPYLAVMDADLQHDVTILPRMLETLKRDRLDIVVGSRHVDGGGTGDWEASRVRIGGVARRIGRLVMRADVADPMSGFFVLSRPFLERTVRRMSGKGFKILMDLFMSAGEPVRMAEIPYAMRARARGESKLDLGVAWEFVALIVDKLIGHIIPFRFIMFALVGTGGAIMHLAVLATAMRGFAEPFIVAQAQATVAAMTVNFFLNNIFTYRDRRLRDWRVVSGLVSFYLVCGVGAFVNIVLATFLYGNAIPWWMAGLMGALVGAVWNYAVTSSFTWTRKPDHPVAGHAAVSNSTTSATPT